MHKNFLLSGSILAGLAVALGAFGAHKLKELVPSESVATFQTGVQYQMYHAIALILVGILFEKFPGIKLKWAGRFFMAGILLFSGSLYLLVALKATDTVGLKGIGMVTPVGGLLFILGWLFVVLGIRNNLKR